MKSTFSTIFYLKKKYRVWEKEVLDPMVKDLADYALDAPQYHASFLLELEKRKMECMDAYFSHSVTADENGIYPGGRWLRLCVKLLGYLVNENSIPENKILTVNPRNINYPVSQWELDHFNNPTDDSAKLHCGSKIYWHKAHRTILPHPPTCPPHLVGLKLHNVRMEFLYTYSWNIPSMNIMV